MSAIEPEELTPKVCRYCRCWYLSPKGSRWPGCRCCRPTLADTPTLPANDLVLDGDGYATFANAQTGDIPF
jgi:hypothetical protein